MLCALLLILSGRSLAADPPFSLAEEEDGVMGVDDAVTVVEEWADAMQITGELDTAEGMEKMTDIAEIMTYRAASSAWSDADLIISKDTISDLVEKASAIRSETENQLAIREIELDRKLPVAVRFTTQETDLNLTIMPDILSVSADTVSIDMVDEEEKGDTIILVKTPRYQIALPLHALQDDLEEPLRIELRSMGEASDRLVEVSLSNEEMAGFFILSLFVESEDSLDTEITVLENLDGEGTACKYDALTGSIDGKISASGIYTIKEERKSSQLTDLGDLDDFVRKAIESLYNQNVINGTTPTTFSPYASLTRGAFVKMIVNAIKMDSKRWSYQYADITKNDYYYYHAGSAKRYEYMEGYDDDTFRGGNNLTKAHICKILGNILQRERSYLVPKDPSKYLKQYQDDIADYARNGVAILTKIGVLEPVNGKFDNHQMNRGEVAVFVYAVLKALA